MVRRVFTPGTRTINRSRIRAHGCASVLCRSRLTQAGSAVRLSLRAHPALLDCVLGFRRLPCCPTDANELVEERRQRTNRSGLHPVWCLLSGLVLGCWYHMILCTTYHIIRCNFLQIADLQLAIKGLLFHNSSERLAGAAHSTRRATQ